MGEIIQDETPVTREQLEEELIRGLRSGPAIEMGPAERQELRTEVEAESPRKQDAS
ncbi:MAG TPA: hypothetical protein VNW54_09635 [Granulicella sp.]|jgi:hypothetical protein|nr:hypothetical protein [Granulicella sp.]